MGHGQAQSELKLISPNFSESEFNSRKFIALFSHILTSEQLHEIHDHLGIQQVIYLQEPLQALWSQVPPNIDSLREYLKPLIQWLDTLTCPGDHILVQGDFGACVYLVGYCLQRGLVPLYATTERRHIEQQQEDGSILIQKQFIHSRFRVYENFVDNRSF